MRRQTSTDKDKDRVSGARHKRDFLILGDAVAEAASEAGGQFESAMPVAQSNLQSLRPPSGTQRDEFENQRSAMAGIVRLLGTAGELGDRAHRAAYEEKARAEGRSMASSGIDPQWALAAQYFCFEQIVRQALTQSWPKGMFSRSGAGGESFDKAVDDITAAFAVLAHTTDLMWTAHAEEQRNIAKAEFEERASKERETVNTEFGGAVRGLMVGDLQNRITASVPADHRELAATFNVALDRIQSTFAAIVKSLLSGNDRAETSVHALGELAGNAGSAANHIAELAGVLEELSGAGTGRDAFSGVEAVIVNARDSAENGGKVMSRAVEAMSGIEGLADRIGQITAAIDDIAFQTNLLALNAGIEAARAGEAGRGFAVVAQEVRALAQRSTEAAKEIESLVGDTKNRIDAGVEAVNTAGTAIDEVVGRFGEIDAAIAQTVEESGQDAGEVARLRSGLETAGAEAASVAAQSERAQQSVAHVQTAIVQLGEIVRRFRLGGTDDQQALHNSEIERPDMRQLNEEGSDPRAGHLAVTPVRRSA
ncbi:methyl-accepting chemotaxis protein [Hoeflea sp.]|uniref:methyl-accepting chemotaxis protein n=1 Tax=Hoeflea sp. TaxID=1940281 RepID=UPI003B029C76